MDFKKFGNVVLILGIVILVYGGFQWLSNQPKSPDYVKSPYGTMKVYADNSDADANRSTAIKILIAGAIVAFVGLGISYSAKPKD